MTLTISKSTAALAAIVTAGVSGIFIGATPALALSPGCAPAGNLVAPGICEQTFTSDGVFAPTSTMTKLEVLLVGAGGAGADSMASGSNGYGGGGGEVKVVNFSGASNNLVVTVPTAAVPGTVTSVGKPTATVNNGENAVAALNATSGIPGASGNSNPGYTGYQSDGFGGGGGAGSSPLNNVDGGGGAVVSAVAGPGSLFTGDSLCYGGGGAVGVGGGDGGPAVVGVATCGGGAPTNADLLTLIAPASNSGGGGGAIGGYFADQSRSGADGLVVIRWTAVPVTLSFDTNGHGVSPASQTFPAGNPGAKPTDPTAESLSFKGWFSDTGLTHPVDFTVGIPASTTYYAKWGPALAATGGTPNPAVFPIGLAALLAGALLFATGYRRKREES